MSRRRSMDRTTETTTTVEIETVIDAQVTPELVTPEKLGLPWWYATPMPYPWDGYLWHQWQSAWAQITLDVCDSVWRRQGAKLYAPQRDKELRDDLRDWLIVTAVESSADFTPRPWHDAPERNWGAFLYGQLSLRARQHFGQVMGRYSTPSGRAAADEHNRGIGSTDQLDEWEAEDGYRASRHPLHGEAFETADPAHVLIRIEELQHQIDQIEREDRRQTGYFTTETMPGDICLTTGCSNPSIARGLCKSCYQKNRSRSADNCSSEGCVRAVMARGLCSRHYKEARAQAIEDGTWQAYEKATPTGCTVEGCTGAHKGRGLCRRHWEQDRAAKAAHCNTPGCTNKAKNRGLCSTHLRRLQG